MEVGNAALARVLSSLEEIEINSYGKGRETLLHLVAYNRHSGDVEIAKILLDHPRIDVNVRNIRGKRHWGGETPLHVAIVATNVNVELVKMLLNREDTAVNVRNGKCQHMLSLVAGRWDPEILGLFLDHKDICTNSEILREALEKATPSNSYGYAQSRHEVEIVRMLATHENLDIHAEYRHSRGVHFPALIHAAYQGRSQLMEFLLARDDVNVNATDSTGSTALHHCLQSGCWISDSGAREVLRLLLSHQGIDVHARDNDGRTPAYYARQRGIRSFYVYKKMLFTTRTHRRNAS